jgi:hypothetical protein
MVGTRCSDINVVSAVNKIGAGPRSGAHRKRKYTTTTTLDTEGKTGGKQRSVRGEQTLTVKD